MLSISYPENIFHFLMWIHVLPKGSKRPIHSSLLESQKKLTKQDQNCRVNIEEQVMVLSSLIVIKWNKKSLNAYEPKAKLSGRVNHPLRVPFLEVDPGCPLSLLLDTGSFLQGQQTWSWVQPWSLVGVEGEEDRGQDPWPHRFHLYCSRHQCFHRLQSIWTHRSIKK